MFSTWTDEVVLELMEFKFHELKFFTGDFSSQSKKGMILILEEREVETDNGVEKRPILMAIKQGLIKMLL